jgi:hypothetical protein
MMKLPENMLPKGRKDSVIGPNVPAQPPGPVSAVVTTVAFRHISPVNVVIVLVPPHVKARVPVKIVVPLATAVT